MKAPVVPPAAQRDEGSVQTPSAWVAEEGPHCSINIGMRHDSEQDEPAACGILLPDVVQHIADAAHDRYRFDEADTMPAIIDSLDGELDEPTSDTEGSFEHGPH